MHSELMNTILSKCNNDEHLICYKSNILSASPFRARLLIIIYIYIYNRFESIVRNIYTPYEGPNLANQNSRKWGGGVLTRSLREATPYVIVTLNIRYSEDIMKQYCYNDVFFTYLCNYVYIVTVSELYSTVLNECIRNTIHNFELINQEAILKSNIVEPARVLYETKCVLQIHTSLIS